MFGRKKVAIESALAAFSLLPDVAGSLRLVACEGGSAGSFGSCASQISHLGRACDCTNVQRGHARGSASIATDVRLFLPQARHVAPTHPLRYGISSVTRHANN